jgi:hypothetical protein
LEPRIFDHKVTDPLSDDSQYRPSAAFSVDRRTVLTRRPLPKKKVVGLQGFFRFCYPLPGRHGPNRLFLISLGGRSRSLDAWFRKANGTGQAEQRIAAAQMWRRGGTNRQVRWIAIGILSLSMTSFLSLGMQAAAAASRAQ